MPGRERVRLLWVRRATCYVDQCMRGWCRNTGETRKRARRPCERHRREPPRRRGVRSDCGVSSVRVHSHTCLICWCVLEVRARWRGHTTTLTRAPCICHFFGAALQRRAQGPQPQAAKKPFYGSIKRESWRGNSFVRFDYIYKTGQDRTRQDETGQYHRTRSLTSPSQRRLNAVSTTRQAR